MDLGGKACEINGHGIFLLIRGKSMELMDLSVFAQVMVHVTCTVPAKH